MLVRCNSSQVEDTCIERVRNVLLCDWPQRCRRPLKKGSNPNRFSINKDMKAKERAVCIHKLYHQTRSSQDRFRTLEQRSIAQLLTVRLALLNMNLDTYFNGYRCSLIEKKNDGCW